MNKQNKKKISLTKPIISNVSMLNFTFYFYGIWLLISFVVLYANLILGAIMVGLTLILIFGEWGVKDKKYKKSDSCGKI